MNTITVTLPNGRTVTIAAGDVVEYDCFGEHRVVRVDHVDDNIKNGFPGFDGIMITESGQPDGMSVWGYADQITKVIPATRVV